MKIYLIKIGNSFKVLKETTAQSILTDLATCAVIILVIACPIAYGLLVGRSWIIEVAAVFFLIALMLGKINKKKQAFVSKEQLIEEIQKLLNAEK